MKFPRLAGLVLSLASAGTLLGGCHHNINSRWRLNKTHSQPVTYIAPVNQQQPSPYFSTPVNVDPQPVYQPQPLQQDEVQQPQVQFLVENNTPEPINQPYVEPSYVWKQEARDQYLKDYQNRPELRENEQRVMQRDHWMRLEHPRR